MNHIPDDSNLRFYIFLFILYSQNDISLIKKTFFLFIPMAVSDRLYFICAVCVLCTT
jgi:hypothetical protein